MQKKQCKTLESFKLNCHVLFQNLNQLFMQSELEFEIYKEEKPKNWNWGISSNTNNAPLPTSM